MVLLTAPANNCNSIVLSEKIQCLAQKSQQLELRLHQFECSYFPFSIPPFDESEHFHSDLRQRKLDKLETKLRLRVANKLRTIEQTLGGGYGSPDDVTDTNNNSGNDAYTNNSSSNSNSSSRCSTPVAGGGMHLQSNVSDNNDDGDDSRRFSSATSRWFEKKLEKLQSKIHKLEQKIEKTGSPLHDGNNSKQQRRNANSPADTAWHITSLQSKVYFLDDKSNQFREMLRQYWEQQIGTVTVVDILVDEQQQEDFEFRKRKLLKFEVKLMHKFHTKLRQIERKYLRGGSANANAGNHQQSNNNFTNGTDGWSEAMMMSPYGVEEKSECMKPTSVHQKLERLLYKLNKWKIKFSRIGDIDVLASPLASHLAVGKQEKRTKEEFVFVIDADDNDVIENGQKQQHQQVEKGVIARRKRLAIKGQNDADGVVTKSCLICGDKATGIHYEVLSCNGCKTFFRRTILTGRQYVCKQDGDCRFDRSGRCACRACRFRLCVEAGMSEHAIRRTPSANFILSIARRHFRHSSGSTSSSSSSTSSSSSGIGTTIATLPLSSLSLYNVEKTPSKIVSDLFRTNNSNTNADPLQIIQMLLGIEEKLSRLRHSPFFPTDMEIRIAEAVCQPSTLAQCSKYPKVSKWPSRQSADVPQANEKKQKTSAKFWFYLDLYLGMEYLKTFDFFQAMECEEKIVLTKSVVVPNQILTASYTSMQIHSDTIQYPDGYTPFKYKEPDLLPLEESIKKGAIEQLRAFRPDQVQIALIRAILVLNEHCDRLSPNVQQQIGSIRSQVSHVLFTYLQNKHGAEGGVRQFGDSLNLISTLFEKQKAHYNYFIYRKFVLQNVCQIPLFQDFMDDSTVQQEEEQHK